MGYLGYVQETLPEHAGMFRKSKAQLELQLARDVEVSKNGFCKYNTSKKGRVREMWTHCPVEFGT